MKGRPLLSYLVSKKRSGRVCFLKTVRWRWVHPPLAFVGWSSNLKPLDCCSRGSASVCERAEAHIKSSPPTRKINTEIRRLRGGAGDYFLPRTWLSLSLRERKCFYARLNPSAHRGCSARGIMRRQLSFVCTQFTPETGVFVLWIEARTWRTHGERVAYIQISSLFSNANYYQSEKRRWRKNKKRYKQKWYLAIGENFRLDFCYYSQFCTLCLAEYLESLRHWRRKLNYTS